VTAVHRYPLPWQQSPRAYTDHNRVVDDERLPPDEAEMSALPSPWLSTRQTERQHHESFGSALCVFPSFALLLAYRTQVSSSSLIPLRNTQFVSLSLLTYGMLIGICGVYGKEVTIYT